MNEFEPRYVSDDAEDDFMRLLLQAELASVARLHSAGMKAGFAINGRTCIHPISFSREILGEWDFDWAPRAESNTAAALEG